MVRAQVLEQMLTVLSFAQGVIAQDEVEWALLP